MNAFQKFSKRLLEGAHGRGIAPPAGFDPPLPRPEDWLSRLGDVAQRLPPRDAFRTGGDVRSRRRAG
jgi:hypothetical protein